MKKQPTSARRKICFVTGTRAEFGLMAATLRAIAAEPTLSLQLVVTGTHTHAARGRTQREIERDGWTIDAAVPWPATGTPAALARQTGTAMARLAATFGTLAPDVVLVVGDRVEAFAAASAAAVGGRVVAHVHGGDRALGQVDDALRHAISKLAHVHFAATRASGDRLFAMGEDRWRIRVVGAPGIDDVATVGRPRRSRPELCVTMLHPTDADDAVEGRRAAMLFDAVRRRHAGPILALRPNGDPGSAGIDAVLDRLDDRGAIRLATHVRRPLFLEVFRDAHLIVGNSSAGVLEAGAFGTPVVDVGPRQAGRERGPNVRHADWSAASLDRAIAAALRQPRTPPSAHPYGRGGAGRRIAKALVSLDLDARLRRKLIRY